MFKQHNGSSAAPLSEVSRASDRQLHFSAPFTHLHHAIFHFRPTIQVAMFLTYQGYLLTVTAKSDHCWKINSLMSACAQNARATALQKYHCEYFRITKSNPRQTSIFHMHVLIPQDMIENNLFFNVRKTSILKVAYSSLGRTNGANNVSTRKHGANKQSV